MANGHGGQRTPRNPAPVSGPGALSRRTDGGQPAQYVSGQDYGDGQELMAQQQAAPMSDSRPQVSDADLAMLARPQQGLFDPAPDGRPLTQGQPFGDGAGPEALATANVQPTRNKLMTALPALMRAAEKPDSSPELRALVTFLRSQQ